MEAIKSWGISTCTVIIIASIVSMVTPNISGKNIIKWIVSAFILFGLLLSLFKLIKSEDFSFKHIDTGSVNAELNYPDTAIYNLENLVAQSLYPVISSELLKCGVEDEFGLKIKLESKNDGISIKTLHISVSNKHKNDIDDLEIELEKKLGLKIDVDVTKPEGD